MFHASEPSSREAVCCQDTSGFTCSVRFGFQKHGGQTTNGDIFLKVIPATFFFSYIDIPPRDIIGDAFGLGMCVFEMSFVRILVVFALQGVVCCITVNTPSKISAVCGGTVTLSCSFSSSSDISSLVSVDWTFRAQSGGPARMLFHYSFKPYPPEDEQFRSRVRWSGDLARGDASIQLLNSSLTDNGTYTCAVRNPPDVHGSPAQSVLRVTPPDASLRLTDIAVLMLFVLVSSACVVLLMLGQMLCPCCRDAHKTPPGRSPIEVASGEECFYHQPTHKHSTCCYLQDSDEDFEYDDDDDEEERAEASRLDEKPREIRLTQSESQC